MPKSKETFLSVQLQSYLHEPRADGSTPTVVIQAVDAASTKEAAMREYVLAWEKNWKFISTIRQAHNHLTFPRLLDLITAKLILGVLLTPQ